MKYLISFFILITTTTLANALVINEILSNPIGDDSGREWVEIYNNTDSDVDVSTLTVSIKSGSFIPVTPVSGGVILSARGYGVIGSTVSGATRFTQDFPAYSGPLFRSAMSLVNTGVTSIELKLQGSIVDTLASYTAAKEGSSYSLFQGSYAVGSPTPGEENKVTLTEEDTPTTTPPTGTQSTLPQASPPSADITLYLPKEKIVVAGAPALFSVTSMTRTGKVIDGIAYTWGFGDGGQATGSSTLYRYLYPGRYVAQVEGTNGLIAGTGRMIVRVVSPDILISSIGSGKYGNYIDVTNPSAYDLDISSWKITIDGAPFSFPKNTLLANGVTRFTGVAMGFASTTVSSSTLIKLLFPNMDEVLRVTQGAVSSSSLVQQSVTQKQILSTLKPLKQNAVMIKNTPRVVSSSSIDTSPVVELKNTKKDTRLAVFMRSFFSK